MEDNINLPYVHVVNCHLRLLQSVSRCGVEGESAAGLCSITER